MKKRILLLFLTTVLCIVCSIPVFADDALENIPIRTISEQTESPSSIPQQRLLPRLIDQADLLTDLEEDALLTQLNEISERQQCDVAVVTVLSLEGKTSSAYADDFYDYNGYGMGNNDDGILLLISMQDRDWAITTHGFAITAFTDQGQKYMVDRFKNDLSIDGYREPLWLLCGRCGRSELWDHSECYIQRNPGCGNLYRRYRGLELRRDFGFQQQRKDYCT